MHAWGLRVAYLPCVLKATVQARRGHVGRPHQGVQAPVLCDPPARPGIFLLVLLVLTCNPYTSFPLSKKALFKVKAIVSGHR